VTTAALVALPPVKIQTVAIFSLAIKKRVAGV